VGLPPILYNALYLSSLQVPFSMFTRHKHGLHTMSALWLLPVVPACVAANTAGVLASKMDDAAQALFVFYLGKVPVCANNFDLC
jgi:tellurite resistance protein TehA-like permease